MGVRLKRQKSRNILASVAYRLKPILSLDTLLDVATIANRLALEKASEQGLDIWGDNSFLHKHISVSDRVLEIGCASGRVLSQVNAKERMGIDYNKRLIDAGKRKYPELGLVHGDALDHVDSEFDVIILSHVLEHIDEPEAFLRSLHAERIYIEVPDFDCNILNDVRLHRKRSLIYTDEDHVAEFDRDGLEHMLSSCGLTIIDSEFRWGFLKYWVRPTNRTSDAAGPKR